VPEITMVYGAINLGKESVQYIDVSHTFKTRKSHNKSLCRLFPLLLTLPE